MDLSRLAAQANGSTAERWEGFQAGGGGAVATRQVQIKDVRVETDGAALVLHFLRDGGSIEAMPAAFGLPSDWPDTQAVRLTITNGPDPLALIVTVLGARSRLIERRDLAPHAAYVLEADLTELPLCQGLRPPRHINGIRISAQWGNTWKTEGQRSICGGNWPATDGNQPVRILLNAIERVPASASLVVPLVDGFGQRRLADWPGKIRSVADLRAAAEAESHATATDPTPSRSRYGGFMNGPRFAASGFFRMERDDAGRWWYADPDGHAFWSLGTTGVRTSDCTPVNGREWMFELLPDPTGPERGAYEPDSTMALQPEPGQTAMHWYRYNVERKYGSRQGWRDAVIRRYRAWGFNTVANWSEPIMLEQKEIAHTRTLQSRLPDTARIAERMPDVWCEAWRRRFDDDVRRLAAPQRDNPWILGYFCDNEMPWGALHRGRILDCPPSAPARAAFLACLRVQCPSVAAANKRLGTACASWDELAALTPDRLPPEMPDPSLLVCFVAEYAERYFRIVSETVKRHAPNHLYLGCRFVRRRPHDVVCDAAGRFCDAVTVNCYGLVPGPDEFGPWHRLCRGRPIQIGEHHFPLFSPRQLPPLYAAFTAEERGPMYENFIKCWAGQPYSVGSHWFQFADQPITGRPRDGENQVVGFVDIADNPHKELVAAARRSAERILDWHTHG